MSLEGIRRAANIRVAKWLVKHRLEKVLNFTYSSLEEQPTQLTWRTGVARKTARYMIAGYEAKEAYFRALDSWSAFHCDLRYSRLKKINEDIDFTGRQLPYAKEKRLSAIDAVFRRANYTDVSKSYFMPGQLGLAVSGIYLENNSGIASDILGKIIYFLGADKPIPFSLAGETYPHVTGQTAWNWQEEDGGYVTYLPFQLTPYSGWFEPLGIVTNHEYHFVLRVTNERLRYKEFQYHHREHFKLGDFAVVRFIEIFGRFQHVRVFPVWKARNFSLG